MLVVAVLLTARANTAVAAPLKVACLGTSAMQGYGSSAGHHVTDELAKALGSGFEVKNFAVVGVTVLKKTDVSYWNRAEFKAALDYNPDIVLFWFGGNDSFVQYWNAHKAEFQGDYTDLVRMFQGLPAHPKTFLIRLMVIGNGPVQRAVVENEILPIVGKIATDTGSVLVNYHDMFVTHPEYYPDGFHPNDAGTLPIGKYFAQAITTALADAADAGVSSDGALMDVASETTAVDATVSVDVAMDVPVSPPTTGSGGAGGATTPVMGSGGAGGSLGGGASSNGGGCALAAAATPSTVAHQTWATLALGLLLGLAGRRHRRQRG